MTSIDLQTNSQATQSESERWKSLLFCPVCGHESPADGDWLDGRDDYHDHQVVCPNCEHVVASR